MQATTTNLKETAELYRWAMELHLIDPQEVWHWCEQVAATHPHPPQVLVDAIQLRRLGDEALDLALLQVPGSCDYAQIARRAFGLQLAYLYESRDRLGVVIGQFHSELFQERNIGAAAHAELVYFQQQSDDLFWNEVYMEGAAEAAKGELTENVVSFLEHAARGDLTGYVRHAANWPRKQTGWQYFYKNEPLLWLIGFGVMDLVIRVFEPSPYTMGLYVALVVWRWVCRVRRGVKGLLP